MNKGGGIKSGFGIGYVSIIMIFAVICLTTLAVLSFQAADSDEKLGLKNADFVQDYYAADSQAKQVLMRLDNAALLAAESGFFEDAFPSLIQEEDGVKLTPVMDGIRAQYSVPINERLTLEVTAKFYSFPGGSSRYEIAEWKMLADIPENEDNHLNVWDGSF